MALPSEMHVLEGEASVSQVETFFASAQRDSDEELQRKQAVLHEQPAFLDVLNTVPCPMLALNQNRQIIVVNRKAHALLASTTEEYFGRRPGEAMKCAHASSAPAGCGTGKHCSVCGALLAILASQSKQFQESRECRLNRATADGIQAMDLRVTATPFDADGQQFTILAFEDISQGKRLEVLEAAFFHDLLEAVGAVHGCVRHLEEEACWDESIVTRLCDLSEELIRAIQSHRDVCAGESGELRPRITTERTSSVLEGVRVLHVAHPAAIGKSIRMGEVWQGELSTDRQLLLRVLGNMVKNALEASEPGQAVTLRCEDAGRFVRFSVHNEQVIQDVNQLQIFQRSFTTKEESGHGLGTYSMRLFGEKYLHGKVDFVSREGEGTTFWLDCPKEYEPA